MVNWTPETISILYRQWAPRIFNHFRRLRWTVEDASDLTSDVFTIALERLPQLREGERFGGWLWEPASAGRRICFLCRCVVGQKKQILRLVRLLSPQAAQDDMPYRVFPNWVSPK